MKQKRDCPVAGCEAKNLVKLSNHLFNVHKLNKENRKPYLKQAKQNQPIKRDHKMSKSNTMQGTEYRLVPADFYNKLVAADNTPKPPVDPAVAQLDKERRRIDNILDSETLTDNQKIKELNQHMHPYMKHYKEMVKPEKKKQ